MGEGVVRCIAMDGMLARTFIKIISSNFFIPGGGNTSLDVSLERPFLTFVSGTEGLRRGQPAEDTGSPIQIPVGPGTLGRILNVTGVSTPQKLS